MSGPNREQDSYMALWLLSRLKSIGDTDYVFLFLQDLRAKIA
jgi:hypothetical protein